MKSFLLTVYDPGKSAGRLPPGAWRDGPLLLYIWSVNCKRVKTAVRRALKRLESLRNRTDLDWDLDSDMEEDGEYVYIHDFVKLHGQ